MQIESNGTGLQNGKPIIRFEPHIFRQQLGNDTLFFKNFQYGGAGMKDWQNRMAFLDGAWRSIEGGGQPVQWQAYELAKRLNPEAAARSISMGKGQIMGFNHAGVGYASAQEMLEAFKSEDAQDNAFIRFITRNPALVTAIKAKDWQGIARQFNGGGNVEAYAATLRNKYNELKG